MIYLSASLMKDYLVCEKRAYYRTNNSDKGEYTNSMSIGLAVHEALEKRWDNEVGAIRLGHELLKKYNIETQREKVFKDIGNFFRLYGTDYFSKDDEVETFFKIPRNDNVTWVGKIDRIHNNRVYDWKTSKKPPKDLNNDIQFIVYHLAFEKLKGYAPDRLIYVSLPFQREYIFEPDAKVIDNFKNNTVPEVIGGIKNGEQKRTGLEKRKACDYCAFRKFCFSEMENGR